MSDVMGREPAFPTFSAISHCDEGGMTLRDYFAAKAMVGIVSTASTAMRGFDGFEKHIAQHAYEVADAMLRARAEGQP